MHAQTVSPAETAQPPAAHATGFGPLTILRALWSDANRLPIAARAVLTVVLLRADNASGVTPRLSGPVLGLLAAMGHATVFRALPSLAPYLERIGSAGLRASNAYALRPEGIAKLVRAYRAALAEAQASRASAQGESNADSRPPGPRLTKIRTSAPSIPSASNPLPCPAPPAAAHTSEGEQIPEAPAATPATTEDKGPGPWPEPYAGVSVDQVLTRETADLARDSAEAPGKSPASPAALGGFQSAPGPGERCTLPVPAGDTHPTGGLAPRTAPRTGNAARRPAESTTATGGLLGQVSPTVPPPIAKALEAPALAAALGPSLPAVAAELAAQATALGLAPADAARALGEAALDAAMASAAGVPWHRKRAAAALPHYLRRAAQGPVGGPRKTEASGPQYAESKRPRWLDPAAKVGAARAARAAMAAALSRPSACMGIVA